MGKIYIVGAGPGRADLLTVAAARALAEADVVLYDRLVSNDVLAMIAPGALRIDVGKQEGQQEVTQRRIHELLDQHARSARNVVRLKGGDPFVFGRGAEEWHWLRERGWDVEVVPGVSASLAVPALAGIPPTFRGIANGFAVVTGHLADGRREYWAPYAGIDTLIILMGVKHRAAIARALIEVGRAPAEPVCFVENGTTERERVVPATLGEVAAGLVQVESPAVWVVGEVVRLREALAAAAVLAA